MIHEIKMSMNVNSFVLIIVEGEWRGLDFFYKINSAEKYINGSQSYYIK